MRKYVRYRSVKTGTVDWHQCQRTNQSSNMCEWKIHMHLFLLYMTPDNKKAGSSHEDDVILEHFPGKKMCAYHTTEYWPGVEEERKGHADQHPIKELHHCLPTGKDRLLHEWIRRKIFIYDAHITGNIIFCIHVYRHYKDIFHRWGRKPKTEFYIIRKFAEVLSIFKIFLRTGRELGRGHQFFYNENWIIVTMAV